MVYRNADGELKVSLSSQEFKILYERWRQKPETKEMIAKLAAERRAFIDRVLAEIKAREK